MTNDDWLLQTSIKHGPKNDKGEPIYLTNIRGWTADDLLARAKDLAGVKPQLDAAITAFIAADAIHDQFPQTEQVTQPTTGGKRCAHGDRVFQQGVKAGKPWSGWFCPLPKDTVGKCSPEWA